MDITDETIEYVAKLANILLSEEEKEKAKSDLFNILNYVNKMDELDTKDIEPMSHDFTLMNVFREDIVTNGDASEDILMNSPMKKDDCFMVPKTVE